MDLQNTKRTLSGSGDPLNQRSIDDNRDEAFGAIATYEDEYELEPDASAYSAKQKLYQLLHNNDNFLNLGTANDDDFYNFYEDMQETNIGIFEYVRAYIDSSMLDDAYSLNESITDTNLIETNLKTFYRIYAGKVLPPDSILSTEDSVSVYDIAYQNSVTGGESVINMRALFDLEVYDEAPASSERVANQITKTSQTTSEIRIYPNPAKDKIYITGLENLDGQIKIEIVDVVGKILLKSNNINKCSEINLSNLSQGIYSILIIKDESVFHKLPFIMQH